MVTHTPPRCRRTVGLHLHFIAIDSPRFFVLFTIASLIHDLLCGEGAAARTEILQLDGNCKLTWSVAAFRVGLIETMESSTFLRQPDGGWLIVAASSQFSAFTIYFFVNDGKLAGV